MATSGDNYFDPADEAVIADPYHAYRRLREQAPIYWHQQLGSWLLTRYADCSTVLRDSDTFAADFRRIDIPTSSELLSVQTVDPPEHTRLRNFLGHAFRAVDLHSLERRASEMAAGMLLELQSRESFDFIADFADPLALKTITYLLGVEAPSTDETFSRLNNDLDRSMDAGFEPEAEKPGRFAREHFNRIVVAWIDSKPGRGMLEWVTSHVEGSDLAMDMLVNSTRAFFHAGFEVPSRFLGNAFLALLSNPNAYAKLGHSPELVESALQELVRYVGPVQALSRACTADTQIGPQAIKRGDVVVALIGAANRDPERFPYPDQLVLDREPNPHLAFGRGPHSCLGFRVGLLEARAVIGTLVRRYPDAHLVAEPIPRPNATLRGLRSLMVSLGVPRRHLSGATPVATRATL